VTLAFIIDENVFIWAHTLDPDSQALQLLRDIDVLGHVIAVTTQTYRQYSVQADHFAEQALGPETAFRVIRRLLAEGRVLFFADERVPPVADEERLPEDDLVFVRLAAHVGGVLVTTDNPLRERIEEARGLPLRVVSVQEALLIAQSEA